MAEPSRYDVGGDEAEILKNKLNITDQKTLEDTETILLSDTYKHFFSLLEKGELHFDLKLILQIHKYFLETLYSWAGKPRTVNISKNGILFTPAQHIKKALIEFNKTLSNNVPKGNGTKKELANKLALIHCEFNAIHPFREGNGRTIRLFLDLLAIQNGYGIIGFGKTRKPEYIGACIAGMKKDYKKMSTVIYKGLQKKK